MNRCRKCGASIENRKLRCSKCRKYVDMEVKYNYINKPLAFYFDYYWKYGYRRN